MKFNRRHILQGASVTALIAASPKEAEALFHHAPAPSFPNTTNITAAAFPNWRAARARVIGATGRARIAIVGDSTSMGCGSGTGEAAYNGARPLGSASLLASGLSSRGVPATIDNWTGFGIGSGMTFSLVPAYDPRMSFGASWGALTSPSITWFGGGFINSTGTGVLSFAPNSAFDTFDVHYIQFSGGGSFNVSIDSGASLGLVNTNSAITALTKQTFTVALGMHTIRLTPTSSTQNYIQGIVPIASATNAVDILIGAWGGASSGDWATSATPQSAANALAYFAPDLTIINLAINDNAAGIAPAKFNTNIQTIINKAKLSGDVFLNVPNPINIPGLSAYQAEINNLTASNVCGEVDWLQRYGSWSSANSLGLMFDSFHPNAMLYAQMGDYLAQILVAV
jgi:hypothetical protein